ncbi:NifB/NifX family molybdenum-iron cluster-binding protein [Inediibacterium massiliense]|uniref:NifB/NifX family molybdenum-iron cluster-binding protein n=1 Tax=Inediibacterium massiliense TaxID=1658111 RepID=UPI0006B55CFF|nr:NifB/NifX family molybdenum-iron cluster-binding protein [Inediibacterium massiliense]
MKIAIAKEGSFVSGHFGHCEGFEVFEVDNQEIKERKFIENPGHRPGFLPVFLSEKGVNVIIAGGMGATAQDLFKENNISVIVGAQGKLEDVMHAYINNQLKSTNSVCTEHEHAGECEEH